MYTKCNGHRVKTENNQYSGPCWLHECSQDYTTEFEKYKNTFYKVGMELTMVAASYRLMRTKRKDSALTFSVMWR